MRQGLPHVHELPETSADPHRREAVWVRGLRREVQAARARQVSHADPHGGKTVLLQQLWTWILRLKAPEETQLQREIPENFGGRTHSVLMASTEPDEWCILGALLKAGPLFRFVFSSILPSSDCDIVGSLLVISQHDLKYENFVFIHYIFIFSPGLKSVFLQYWIKWSRQQKSLNWLFFLNFEIKNSVIRSTYHRLLPVFA